MCQFISCFHCCPFSSHLKKEKKRTWARFRSHSKFRFFIFHFLLTYTCLIVKLYIRVPSMWCEYITYTSSFWKTSFHSIRSTLQSRRRRRHLLIELNSTMKANARNAATVSQLLLLAFSTFSHEHNSRSPLSTLPLLRLLRCALLFQMTPPFLFFYADLFILQFLFFPL